MNICVVILTLNEAPHMQRCLDSVAAFAHTVLVVDAYSSDATVDIARQAGATVVQRQWTSHADQFNWAMHAIPDGTDWVMRVDADEIVSQGLAAQIVSQLPALGSDVHGVSVRRSIKFMGRLLKFGGVGNLEVLRIFRPNHGRYENRWMDEHLLVDGGVVQLTEPLIDHNLRPLSDWIAKHNNYASLEAVDLLNLQYGFAHVDTVANNTSVRGVSTRRRLKESVYARLPLGIRSLLYFFYRYVFRLGVLDRTPGLIFTVLQAFWYRFLVDAKIAEIKQYANRENVGIEQAIASRFGIQVRNTECQ